MDGQGPPLLPNEVVAHATVDRLYRLGKRLSLLRTLVKGNGPSACMQARTGLQVAVAVPFHVHRVQEHIVRIGRVAAAHLQVHFVRAGGHALHGPGAHQPHGSTPHTLTGGASHGVQKFLAQRRPLTRLRGSLSRSRPEDGRPPASRAHRSGRAPSRCRTHPRIARQCRAVEWWARPRTP